MRACSDSGNNARPAWRRIQVENRLLPSLVWPQRLTPMVRPLLHAALMLVVLSGCAGEFPAGASHLDAAKAAYDGERLVESLDSIKDWHIKNNTGIAGALGSGVTVSSIEQALSGRHCKVTEELKQLWSWRDGATSSTPFVWYHDFLSLEDALAEYRWLRVNPLVQWDPQYIPILTFEGEWYAAYCGPDAGTAGPIVHYFLEGGPQIVSVNLTVFMASMAVAFESGAIQWTDGAMVEDIHKLHSIHQRNNPGYAFPYYVPTENQPAAKS